MSELTYTKNGDYLIPDLALTEQSETSLGKYGRMRKSYLKEHRPILWNRLILSEKLYPHLREIDDTANRRLEQMIPELMKANGQDGVCVFVGGIIPEEDARELENQGVKAVYGPGTSTTRVIEDLTRMVEPV